MEELLVVLLAELALLVVQRLVGYALRTVGSSAPAS